jgi:hypothetical protein
VWLGALLWWMQKPLSLPLVTPLPRNCIAQPLQNLHVEMTSNGLFRKYELMMHQTVDFKEFQKLFDCPSYMSKLNTIYRQASKYWMSQVEYFAYYCWPNST